MLLHQIIKRPLITEKGTDKKETERTLCFEVAVDANKTEVANAVTRGSGRPKAIPHGAAPPLASRSFPYPPLTRGSPEPGIPRSARPGSRPKQARAGRSRT